MKTIKYPTIKEISALIRAIKPEICDDYIEEKGDTPFIQITIGFSPNSGNWSYQTGDNSYTGGAYSYPDWAVGYITRRCDSRELARDLIGQLQELSFNRGINHA